MNTAIHFPIETIMDTFELTLLQSRRLLPRETHERNSTNEIVETKRDNHHHNKHNNTTTSIEGTNKRNHHGFSVSFESNDQQVHESRFDESVANTNNRILPNFQCKINSSSSRSSTISSFTNKHIPKAAAPRRAFDTAPFYNEIKPHVTAQKRVRYIHLEEDSSFEGKKRMPKEMLDGPKIYKRGAEAGQKDETKKNGKVPISLNPILPSE